MPKIREGVNLLYHEVRFDNKEQYDLFMLYLRETFVENSWAASKAPSLEEIYVHSSNPGKFEVNIAHEHGNLGVLSKFMEMTGMKMTGTGSGWNYKAHMGPDYGQIPNPGALHLDRRGDTTVPPHIMQKMKNYKQMHPTQARESSLQRQTSAPQRTPAFGNPFPNGISKFIESSSPPTNNQQKKHTHHGQHGQHGQHGHKTSNAKNHASDYRMKIVKNTLSQYESHLHQKLFNEGVIKNLDSVVNPNQFHKASLEPKQLKLLNRYEAISSAKRNIQDKHSLNSHDFAMIKQAVNTCLKNKPEWSERSFLQKFTDVLTLGFKDIYRSLFSKEKEYENKLIESLPSNFKK